MRRLSEAGSESQQKHLKAMIALGNYIIENGPLVQTQKLAGKYKEEKGIAVSQRVASSRLLVTMRKHLNVAQIYINSKGYVIQHPGNHVLDVNFCRYGDRTKF